MRKLRKGLRRTPEAYIDLVEYLQARGHAQTAGEARQIVLDGRVRVESHKLGIGQEMRMVPNLDLEGGYTVEPFDVVHRVPAEHRDRIEVHPA